MSEMIDTRLSGISLTRVFVCGSKPYWRQGLEAALKTAGMLRAACLPTCTIASSSSSLCSGGTRSYAISVQSPRKWPGKTEQRVFSERKTYLYNQFTALLESSQSKPLLFIQFKNFRTSHAIKLRRDVALAGLPKGSEISLLPTRPEADSVPQLSVIRTSIFGVALRHHAPIDAKTTQEIAKMAGTGDGGIAVVTLPSLDPPTIQALLRAFDRATTKKSRGKDDKGKGKAAEDEGRIPGRKLKRQRPLLDPELSLLGAYIEGRVFSVEKVKDVSKLPTLDMLRAQIVGLISSPAAQLAMVLGEASGGRLARTLEGLKKGLEEGTQEPKPEADKAS